MSTRAIYTFSDEYHTVSVYKHSDGYPTGAIEALQKAVHYAWTFPRYEADEFAASFVTANKLPYWMQDAVAEFLEKLSNEPRPDTADGRFSFKKTIEFEVPYYHFGKDSMRGGGVRLIPQNVEPHDFASDVEFRYYITQDKKGNVWVSAYETNYWDGNQKDTFIFKRPLLKAMRCAKEYEADRELFRATHLTKKKVKVPSKTDWQNAVASGETEQSYGDFMRGVKQNA
jgi:hypothetical protein